MAIEKGSMREVIGNVYQRLINDEELLRLLWYKPRNSVNKDPLDTSLPNIIDSDDYWDIVNERVLLTNKTDDLEGKELCRLYISSGQRRANGRNDYMATQRIIIDSFVHEVYQGDLRSEWILDRLLQLLALEYVEGSLGKFDYVKSDPANAPSQYQRFVHYFEYNDMRK
ncbi:hypothetical protein M3649_04180 [Ureibacillus chungkukjangi]|uniref:hypothetical protein n=1 Tax=Ureibacillus chungkukjangi TaxID=1202712 RepID=UPI00203AD0A4|nr:hypothetical protein [Ureibacillus chungkukjangi]MCM3387331.1 hypothetical protein [Ureibacillus chungkukjangi]